MSQTEDTLSKAHKRVGAVQGGLSLAIERHVVSKMLLRVYVKTLRSVADDVELSFLSPAPAGKLVLDPQPPKDPR